LCARIFTSGFSLVSPDAREIPPAAEQTRDFQQRFALMWWLGFYLSVAVAVGFIALAGVAAETGVVMLIYLDSALTDLIFPPRVGGQRWPPIFRPISRPIFGPTFPHRKIGRGFCPRF
jgi:hypothetical protein